MLIPRKTRWRATATAAAVALGAGAALASAPLAASAHTPTVSATCTTLSVSATQYETRPASGSPTVEIPNPDHVPATPGSPAVGTPTILAPNPAYVPAVPAVVVTKHRYVQMVTGKEKILDKFDWNPGLGWIYKGTVSVEVTPEIPAQGDP